MIVSLCGFMGAGKSTIGKHLARVAGYTFIDLDAYIEQKFQMSIPDFFKSHGEAAFRSEELKSLQEILHNHLQKREKSLILSLGGGTIIADSCSKLIKEHTYCIYLQCTKEELVKRLKRNNSNRPILQGKTDRELEEHIEQLMMQRTTAYESSSHCTIDTEGKRLQDIIEEILNKIPMK